MIYWPFLPNPVNIITWLHSSARLWYKKHFPKHMVDPPPSNAPGYYWSRPEKAEQNVSLNTSLPRSCSKLIGSRQSGLISQIFQSSETLCILQLARLVTSNGKSVTYNENRDCILKSSSSYSLILSRLTSWGLPFLIRNLLRQYILSSYFLAFLKWH